MKIVINSRIGQGNYPHKIMMRWAELSGIKLFAYIPNWDRPVGDMDCAIEPVEPATDDAWHIAYALKECRTYEEMFKDGAFFDVGSIQRNDANLIQAIIEMPNDAGGFKLATIPDDVDWDVGSCDDGREWVYEKHRTWTWDKDDDDTSDK